MQMQLSDNVKKGLNIVIRILALIVVIFTVGMMVFTIFSVSTLNEKDRSVFGYKFLIVLTGSMSPSDMNAHLDVHFSPGDIVVVEDISNEEKRSLKEGDIIAFISTNEDETHGKLISHMISTVIKDEKGNVIAYKTMGTNTMTEDDLAVQWDDVEGLYSSKLPKVGTFFNFVKSTKGYILCIFVPFALLILYNGINCIRLFKKYKREQNAVIESEKAEIAAERQQNADMMKELLALKAELERKQAEASAAENAPSSTEESAETVAESGNDSEGTGESSENTSENT